MVAANYGSSLSDDPEGSSESQYSMEEMEDSDQYESEQNDSEINCKPKSRYRGVYNIGETSWVAKGYVDGEQIDLARAKTEEDCAEKARREVSELRAVGKKVYGDYGSVMKDSHQGQVKTYEKSPSGFLGVSYSKTNRMWYGYGSVDCKNTYLGSARSAAECAARVREKCAKLKLEGKKVGNHYGESRQKVCQRSEVLRYRYIGVTYIKSLKLWRGHGSVDNKQSTLGQDKSEEECARKVRERCAQLKAEGKKVHKCYGELREHQKYKTSQFRGVCWNAARKKWKSVVGHNGAAYSCGHFETELDAAKAVNRKCLELGIDVRNPQIMSSEPMKAVPNIRPGQSSPVAASMPSKNLHSITEEKHQELTPSTVLVKTHKQAFSASETSAKLDERKQMKQDYQESDITELELSDEDSLEGENVSNDYGKFRQPPYRYIGVTCVNNQKSWRGDGYVDNKRMFLGSGKSEEECARKVREKCVKFKAEGKKVRTRYGELREEQKNKTSQFRGVSWCKNRRKWRSYVTHNNDKHCCGEFVTELDAAKAVNRKCLELGIDIRNPQILKKAKPTLLKKRKLEEANSDSPQKKHKKTNPNSERKTSEAMTAVSNIPPAQSSHVAASVSSTSLHSITEEKPQKLACSREHANKQTSPSSALSAKPNQMKQPKEENDIKDSSTIVTASKKPLTKPDPSQNKMKLEFQEKDSSFSFNGNGSEFVGVFGASYGGWIARICVDEDRRYLGTFDTAKLAAQAVNQACVKLGISLKNPGVGTCVEQKQNESGFLLESDENLSVIYSSYNQPDSDSGGHKLKSNQGIVPPKKRSVKSYRYIGVTQIGNKWCGRGSIDGKTKHFAWSTSEEDCAKKTRWKVAQLRAEGCRIGNAYGEKKTQKGNATKHDSGIESSNLRKKDAQKSKTSNLDSSIQVGMMKPVPSPASNSALLKRRLEASGLSRPKKRKRQRFKRVLATDSRPPALTKLTMPAPPLITPPRARPKIQRSTDVRSVRKNKPIPVSKPSQIAILKGTRNVARIRTQLPSNGIPKLSTKPREIESEKVVKPSIDSSNLTEGRDNASVNKISETPVKPSPQPLQLRRAKPQISPSRASKKSPDPPQEGESKMSKYNLDENLHLSEQVHVLEEGSVNDDSLVELRSLKLATEQHNISSITSHQAHDRVHNEKDSTISMKEVQNVSKKISSLQSLGIQTSMQKNIEPLRETVELQTSACVAKVTLQNKAPCQTMDLSDLPCFSDAEEISIPEDSNPSKRTADDPHVDADKPKTLTEIPSQDEDDASIKIDEEAQKFVELQEKLTDEALFWILVTENMNAAGAGIPQFWETDSSRE